MKRNKISEPRGLREQVGRRKGKDINNPSPGYTNLLSLDSFYREGSDSAGPVTQGTRLMRGQGSVHSGQGPRSLGRNSRWCRAGPWGRVRPWDTGSSGFLRAALGVSSPAVAGTGLGSPGLHQKVLMGLGNPRVPPPPPPLPRPFMCSGPHSASSATAIFIPGSFQSTALVCVLGGGGEWGSRGNGRGLRNPQEAGVAGEPLCPSKGGLPPPPGPPCPLPEALA